jgi:hypothetical protein
MKPPAANRITGDRLAHLGCGSGANRPPRLMESMAARVAIEPSTSVGDHITVHGYRAKSEPMIAARRKERFSSEMERKRHLYSLTQKCLKLEVYEM